MGQIVYYLGFQADSDNLPLPRAGVYQLINQVNGKSYIGISQNIARRIRQHTDTKLKKLGNATRKYGTLQFLVHPIAYSVDDKTDWLPVLEAQLIVEFDTIKNGYNVNESAGNVGPYGEEFSKIVKETYTPERRVLQSKVITEVSNRPEVKQKFIELQKKLWSDPNYKPNRSWQQQFASDKNSTFQLRAREVVKRPEVREKIKVSVNKTWSDPELRQKQSQAKLELLQDEDFRTAHLERFSVTRSLGTDAAAKAITGSIWITDGKVNRRFRPDQGLPEGFSIGRTNLGNLGRKPRVRNRVLL